MDFLEIIRLRQSDRKYSEQAVEKEKIAQIIEAARLAPSANNSQSWKFIVIDDSSLKNAVAATAASLGMNKFAQQAPLIIAVVVEKALLINRIGKILQNKDYSQIDIGIAVAHICLQATELGLGSCILGWFNEKKVKQLLRIPSGKRVVMLVTLGYSADNKREKNRKKLEEISSRNAY